MMAERLKMIEKKFKKQHLDKANNKKNKKNTIEELINTFSEDATKDREILMKKVKELESRVKIVTTR